MKKSLIFSLSLISLSAMALSSCSAVEHDESTKRGGYEGINLHYRTGEAKMNDFLNDFTHRNMRYDSDSVGEFKVTGGTGFAKNWETMAVAFQNSSAQVYREDKIANIATYLLNADQDDMGLIYNTNLVYESYLSEQGGSETTFSVPQGWPFPIWKNAVENYADYGLLEASYFTTFEFNDGYDPQCASWVGENGDFHSPDHDDEIVGYATFSCEGESSFLFHKDDLDELLPYRGGIDTRCAPMVEVDIEFAAENLDDYSLIFKVEGDDSWHKAPQKVYSSIRDENKNGYHRYRRYFDMYLNPDWNHNIVTSIGIEFEGKEGAAMSLSGGRINYIRPGYDTRQSNATYQFILAVYNYFSYTRDYVTLEKLMPKVRKAILFLTHALEGEKGLLNTGYMYGHDGIGAHTIDKDMRHPYHGIGNGYFDLTVTPMYCLEANTYFYQALKAASILEDAAKKEGINQDITESVKNRMPHGDDVPYEYDASSLDSLAKEVKTNMEKPILPVAESFDYSYNAGDYRFQNKGGFYNPSTGRFALGINEYTGEILDCGHLYLNLEAVAAGIGTDEQRLSIMRWVDGDRVVDGDKSTGDDIYFSEFAPRHNTKDARVCYGFFEDENFDDRFYSRGYDTWSRQVQNGGAVIAWSYYDLVARAKVLGPENAYKRLGEIRDWYLKVKEGAGNSYYFYDDYYDLLDFEATIDDPDNYMIYSIQDAVNRGGGALGLDAEFIESVILIKAIPDALFGMDANGYNDLSFTYGFTGQDDFFEIYNMKYGDTVYSIRQEKDAMEIFNISGIVSREHVLTFRYKTDNADIAVLANGKAVEDKTYEDGYLTIKVPFDNVRIIFG